jgi:hypothetical protein
MLDVDEPEIHAMGFHPQTGAVGAELRLSRSCSVCGNEVEDTTLVFSGTFLEEIIAEHQGSPHELGAHFDEPTAFEESGS